MINVKQGNVIVAIDADELQVTDMALFLYKSGKPVAAFKEWDYAVPFEVVTP